MNRGHTGRCAPSELSPVACNFGVARDGQHWSPMQLYDALKQNPALIAILWLIVSALLTAVFGPHSDAQLAVYPPWFAKVLHFTGALGIDVPKLIQVLRGGGAGPSALAIVIMIWFSLSFSGCAWWAANGKAVEQGGLQASEIACVVASELTSAPEIALACKIDAALVPEIEKLLADPKFSKARSAYRASLDGGVEAGK